MDPDDRARLTEEMPAKVARRLLAGLSPNERRLTSTLLGYPEDSAGRLMSPEVASLPRRADRRTRRWSGCAASAAPAETIYALPVTDDRRRLLGALGLRDLVPRRSRHARSASSWTPTSSPPASTPTRRRPRA